MQTAWNETWLSWKHWSWKWSSKIPPVPYVKAIRYYLCHGVTKLVHVSGSAWCIFSCPHCSRAQMPTDIPTPCQHEVLWHTLHCMETAQVDSPMNSLTANNPLASRAQWCNRHAVKMCTCPGERCMHSEVVTQIWENHSLATWVLPARAGQSTRSAYTGTWQTSLSTVCITAHSPHIAQNSAIRPQSPDCGTQGQDFHCCKWTKWFCTFGQLNFTNKFDPLEWGASGVYSNIWIQWTSQSQSSHLYWWFMWQVLQHVLLGTHKPFLPFCGSTKLMQDV